MRVSIRHAGLALAAALTISGPFVIAQSQAPPAQGQPAAALGSLDAFMQTVLARREINRTTLNEYVLDETEAFEVLGPGRSPLFRQKKDFTWYVRDGMHVRSPVRFGGVSVGPAERDEYERDWIRREKERQERKAKNEREKSEVSIGSGGVTVTTGGAVSTEPRFVSESYFMDFKFEAGNYYLAGRETLEGHDVLRIEYYPTHLFDGDEDKDKDKNKESTDKKAEGKTGKPAKDAKGAKEKQKDKAEEEDIERKMNKTALVTLWVDPVEHQIVKYTFDNVWMDFLPGAWLVRVDDLRASMTMGQPFPGVWLPRGMTIHAGITLANGSYEAGYARTFSEYREASVTTKLRIPKDEAR